MLWFAWKIVLLQYHKHRTSKMNSLINCCDLLEKSYFCSITNIAPSNSNNKLCVVICLKNRTFAVSQTSPLHWSGTTDMLWFAWKIVLLQYHKHPYIIANAVTSVVICLKNRTFAVSQTSRQAHSPYRGELWFAWKIVLLQYHKHPRYIEVVQWICCDLLEKSYFCSITNISVNLSCCTCPVVICLKNRTFAVSQTSTQSFLLLGRSLWFAWKIVLLQYHKHLKYHIYLYYKQIQRFKK